MTDPAPPTAPATTDVNAGPITRFLRATEIDTRLLGMIGALLLIWVGFHSYGAIVNGYGAFLTPRNLWNLSVQTSSIGIMATGMVLVIITRNIDLSVGA
ncbi:MAG: sugar ABC transporter permease, partial [Albidovulum sp.]